MKVQPKISTLSLVRKKHLEQAQKRQQNKLKKIREVRLTTGVLFGLALFGLPIFKNQSITMVVLAYWFLVFPYFVWLSRRYARSIRQYHLYLEFLLRQEERQQGRISAGFYNSKSPKDELNITGPNSLYDFINETWSLEGAKKLEQELVQSQVTEDAIQERQNLIQGLSCRSFQLLKLKIKMTVFNPKGFGIEKAFSQIRDIKGLNRIEHFTLVAWISCVALLTTSQFWKPLSGSSFLALVIFWIFQILCFQKRGVQFFKALDIEAALTSLMPIFQFCAHNKHLKELQKVCPKLLQENPLKLYDRIKIFVTLSSVETHILVTFILNLLMPYHILVSLGLRKQVEPFLKFESDFKKEMENIDVLSSLVFLHRYHTQTFPSFSKDLSFIVEEISLPLIAKSVVVKNNFVLTSPQKITLITGSNMSGKSTFLRTIAQNQALALMGAPVFARSYRAPFAKIESCINITDSVMLSYSYFLSEVKRLKEIYDSVGRQKVIFFLDELFRGTNQKERVIAAKSFLKDLSAKDCIGFITTHDSEITELTEKSEKFKTCYFSEDFSSDDITFTYKIQDGIANTTNALRILKREGLPVYEN